MTIMITLNKIRKASPCAGGWKKALSAHKHLGMYTEFPLSNVLDSNGLEDTLWCFNTLPEHIEISKRFALWCARQVQHLMTDEYVNLLDVSEMYLDGDATLEELRAARAAYAYAHAAARAAYAYAHAAARAAYAYAYAYAHAAAAGDAYAAAACAAYAYADRYEEMQQKQIDKFRKMIDDGEK